MTTTFVWDGADYLQIKPSSGDATLLISLMGEVVGHVKGSEKRDYVTDPLGSVVAYLNDSQTLTDRFEYWPYGELAGEIEAGVGLFLWVGSLGYFRDSDLRTYVRARTYRQDLGSWLQLDPPLLAATGYADSDPVGLNHDAGLRPRGKQPKRRGSRHAGNKKRGRGPGLIGGKKKVPGLWEIIGQSEPFAKKLGVIATIIDVADTAFDCFGGWDLQVTEEECMACCQDLVGIGGGAALIGGAGALIGIVFPPTIPAIPVIGIGLGPFVGDWVGGLARDPCASFCTELFHSRGPSVCRPMHLRGGSVARRGPSGAAIYD